MRSSIGRAAIWRVIAGGPGAQRARYSLTGRRESMKIGMVVLAGGVGKRIGRPFPKQFLLLGGKPLLVHVLEKARVIADIDRVVITCRETHLEETRKLIANHGFDVARFSCIVGGTSRQESVYLG